MSVRIRSVLASCLFALVASFAFFVPMSVLADDTPESVHDAQVPLDDAAAIELGKAKYGEKCGGFCHGSGGKGARAPCLICGRFKRGGKDSDLIRNITNGVAGTGMGAFGGMYSKEEIVALVAYLRAEQKAKEAAQ